VVSSDQNLSGEMEVGPDGALRHPIYNQLKLDSVPLPLLKDTIASFLRKFEREPRLEVEPLFKTTILGEVRTPNIYFLAPGTIVSDAIAHAGGMTDRADPARVTILRDGRRLSTSLNGSAGNPALSILSGDQISVAQRRNVLGSMIPIIGVAVSVISLVILSQR
jgi:protein involved in polysaccharide export with SLBB domain